MGSQFLGTRTLEFSISETISHQTSDFNFDNKEKILSRDSGYPDWALERGLMRNRAGSVSGSEINLVQRLGPNVGVTVGSGTLERRNDMDPFKPPSRPTSSFGRGMISSSSVTDLNLNPIQQMSFNPAMQVFIFLPLNANFNLDDKVPNYFCTQAQSMTHLNCPTCNQGLLWTDNWEQIRGSNMALQQHMRYNDHAWSGSWHNPNAPVIPHHPMVFPQHPINMVGSHHLVSLNGRSSRPPSPALSVRSRSVCTNEKFFS